MRENQMKRAFLTLAILTVTLLWCVFAHAQSLGPITTPQMNKAYFFVGTSPYLTTIQSAVTAACATGKGEVVVPPGVTPSDAPGAVTGCTAVGLVVQTTLPWACYASTGGTYSATNCSTSSGGGTVTSVSSGNLSPLFTVTVQNGSTTPNFVFSLSNAGQNAFLGGPASGGSGAPSYRALMVADLPTGIPNANLLNPSTTVNGQTCTLGGSCTVTQAVSATPTIVCDTTTNPGCTVTILGSNTAGIIEYNSNSSPATDTVLVTITFNGAAPSSPRICTISAFNSFAAAATPDITVGGFISNQFGLGNETAPLPASTLFEWTYVCSQ
jgi:hypothetical protein